MAKQKRPDLSKTDAFQRSFLQLAQWVKRNVRAITIVLVPLAVVIIAIAIGQIYLQSQKTARLTQLAAVNNLYNDEQQAAADRSATLRKKIKEIKDVESKKKVKGKLVKKDELQQLEQQLKDVRADHQRSFAQYRDFFNANPRSPEGWAAAMSAIGIALVDKKQDTAQELLTELLKHSTKNDFYQVQARLLHIKLLEEQGKVEQALTETEQIYRLAPDDFKPETLLIKARLLLAQQQTSAARAVCEEIIKNFADSRAASKAKAIKVLLN